MAHGGLLSAGPAAAPLPDVLLPQDRRVPSAAAIEAAQDEPRKVKSVRFVLVTDWTDGPGRQLLQAAAAAADVPLLRRDDRGQVVVMPTS